jgi:acyl-CoA hydrolase
VTDHFTSPDAIADAIIAAVGPRIVLALPLGIGKPCHIVNALVGRAVADASIDLQIFTALTLEAPQPGSELERRFLGPARQRLFGAYPGLDYARMQREGSLPENIRINEFFFLAGRWLGVPAAQQAHISANYTHVQGYMLDRGVNLLTQLVARREAGGEKQYSLSSNTDLTLDLLKARREGRVNFVMAAQANSELPFMTGEAVVEVSELDFLLDSPETDFELFSAPRRPINHADQAIGLHAARLVRDGGTLQVGIGSIGDAVSAALILRHEDNSAFREIVAELSTGQPDRFSDCGVFEAGLYAASEMLVQGLLELVEHGVIRREVDGVLVHAAFFVESRDFYRRLREMSDAERHRFRMGSVSFTNQLYGGEDARREARAKACFINNAMKATLLGAVISDALADGAVVSGVGGQFNFVTQAFALPDARSVLTLAATRWAKGSTESNIVWSFPHATVPRHMRDVIITEYGIADLRGKTDAEVIAAMLSVADSRFQESLLGQARAAGKIKRDFEIPEAFRANTPERIERVISSARKAGRLGVFPFGSDFTETEQRLLPALNLLQRAAHSKLALLRLIAIGWRSDPDPGLAAGLARMGLDQPRGVQERVYRALLQGALVQIMGSE